MGQQHQPPPREIFVLTLMACRICTQGPTELSFWPGLVLEYQYEHQSNLRVFQFHQSQMPSRPTYKMCFCLLCKEEHSFREDGMAIGGRVLRTRLDEHLALCEITIAERRAKEAAAEAYRASVGSALFLSTLRNENVERLPKVHDQNDEATADADDLSSQDFPSMAEIGNDLPRLTPPTSTLPLDSYNLPSLTKTAHLPLPRPPSPLLLPFSQDFEGLWETDTIQTTVSKHIVKRERNCATYKAHLVFDAIERELSNIALTIRQGRSSINNEYLFLIEKGIVQLRQRFETVRRSVPSLDSRREILRQQFTQLEAKLESLGECVPSYQKGPREYDTGVFFYRSINCAHAQQ